MSLFGQNDENLRLLRARLGATVVARGDELRLSGEADAVAEAERTFKALLSTIRAGGRVSVTELEFGDLSHLEAAVPGSEVAEGAEAGLPARAKPKTATQRLYVVAIRENPITFGIGPAGTGKTYLAVAMAVQALTTRRVKRVILTRPAVEAGEKLGFLPGDLQAKIDPYLRPLYDALYDMLPPDRVDQLL
jgi:phosphate starvation-inducible protein PhoH and related proteins